jgi:hypothetical protein
MHMMRFLLAVLFFVCYQQVPAQELSYYLPDSLQYNPAIPKPKDIIYHQVGAYHLTHDRLVNSMQAIAKAHRPGEAGNYGL